jgi:hypothetical protein
LYSTDPRRSALGAAALAASRAASAMFFSSGALPSRKRAAWTASIGVGPRVGERDAGALHRAAGSPA